MLCDSALDGARVCMPNSVDRKELGLVREEEEIVDHGNMRENKTLVTLYLGT